MTTSLSPFQVQCPSCESEFPVDPERVPPGGVHAICSVCQRTFPVDVPADPPSAAMAQDDEDPYDGAADLGVGIELPEAPPSEPGDGGDPAPASDVEVEADAEEAAPIFEPDPFEPLTDVPDRVFTPPPPRSDDEGTRDVPEHADAAEPDPYDFSTEAATDPSVDASLDAPADAPAPPAPQEDEEDRAALDEETAAREEHAGSERWGDVATPEEDRAALEDLSGLTHEALAEDDDDRPGSGGSDRASLSLGAARFGRRDPHDRARRLARVLVSDIIAYYPEKHEEAVRRGKVKEEFEEEVRKSRKEYVDQVGEELAESTSYFREALNEVLARGRQIY